MRYDLRIRKRHSRYERKKERFILNLFLGQGLRKVIKERDERICDKERRVYDLKKKNQELEKFKFVLDYKIKELKILIEPKEAEIEEHKERIHEMEIELRQ